MGNFGYFKKETVFRFVLILACSVCIFLLLGCTKPESTRRILKSQGYADINITGYSWLSCSEDDEYHTGFTAIRNGEIVSGVVCEGLFLKNATIRFKT